VLYVTLSERRRENLRQNCHEAVRTIAFFTTLAEAMNDPYGEIWIDVLGKRESIGNPR
jgi:hypothetical protein